MKQLATHFNFIRLRLSPLNFRSLNRTLVFAGLFLLMAAQAARAQYCVPAFGGPGCATGMLIHTFSLVGTSGTRINDVASGCASMNYSDSSTVSTVTLVQGGAYTAYISTFGTPAGVQIWIDFNNNFNFEATEMVGGMNGVAMDPTLSPVTVNIPGAAATGSHRMRAVLTSGTSFPMIPPCPIPPTTSQGEVHDYTVVITAAAASCPAVTGLAAGSITSTGAAISWTAATGSVGYQYVVNTSATAPTGTSGTYTASTSFNATSLSPATLYYAHVRDTCGPSNVSAWTTISFTTLAAATCPAVTGLTASGVTNTAATISWTAATGSAGYRYVIDNMAASPTSFGTYTTATSISPTGLTPATVYYAHVRDTCGAGNVSSWVTISFTTTATAPTCPPVSALAATGVTSTGATISWTPASGAVGYKYVVNTTPTTPTIPGNFTTLNSTPVSALSPGTIYYAHVRDSCGVGNVSVWVTVSFTTLGTASVNNVVNPAGNLLSIIPNPVSGTAAIAFHGEMHANAQVQIIDITGRVIKTMPLTSGTAEADMSVMPSGIYICKYTDAETTTSVRISKQ